MVEDLLSTKCEGDLAHSLIQTKASTDNVLWYAREVVAQSISQATKRDIGSLAEGITLDFLALCDFLQSPGIAKTFLGMAKDQLTNGNALNWFVIASDRDDVSLGRAAIAQFSNTWAQPFLSFEDRYIHRVQPSWTIGFQAARVCETFTLIGKRAHFDGYRLEQDFSLIAARFYPK
ncbi:hypothetical protein Q5752_005947 [Cryptotrichosporon argae]